MAVSTPPARTAPAAPPGRLHGLGCCAEDEALRAVEAGREGLTPEQVEERQARSGPNTVAHERPPAWYVQLMHAFATPFTFVLTALAAVSFATGDLRAVVVIGSMVVLATVTRFVQEYRSNRAAQALQAMVRTRATAQRQVPERRSGEPRPELDLQRPPAERRRTPQAEGPPPPLISRKVEVAIEELVPGDIVHLSAGDMIPADIRILSAKDLFVSQSALTGEALPVEKWPLAPDPAAAKAGALPELPTVCFLGTSVVSGTATAVVVETGSRTYFGSMAKSIVGQRPVTSFDLGVRAVSWLLIRFMLVMVPIVLLINGFTKHDWVEAFLFATAVAVGLTPEMLPMIVTANLAKGAVAMARRKTIVRRINSIQNFGAMDILCTDKTGTLTQDRIILERHLNLVGEDDDTVLDYAFLNSFHQTGLKNLLDVAVLEHAELKERLGVEREYRKVDEIPFDFTRRRMSVVVLHGEEHLLICKGAVEEILPLCPRARDEDRVLPVTDEARRNALELMEEMNEDGLRVVAVAYRSFPPTPRTYTVADEADLVLAGFIGFLDPPKESAAPALAALREHGVAVKIITGDNEVVTRKVCRDVGLEPGEVLLGGVIDDMDDAELVKTAEKTTVFAKITPLQKARVVASLRRAGHTVGFLGDGINDAGALREADVGVSVDSAVDIAKESADIILLEKSLMVLEEGVLEGRKVFGNIIKYIKMTASSNFGNVFSVLAASAFLPFLPMLPIQLLTVNLLYDFSQAAIPFDNMDPEYLRKPRKWRADDIGRFMLIVGPTSSVFDITTFLLMWFVFFARVGHEPLFRSGWFVESLLSQTMIVHMIRTSKIPFIQSRAATPVLLTTAACILVGMALPFTAIGEKVGLAPLPAEYFLFLLLTLVAYGTLVQSVKLWYLRRYRRWL